MTAALAPTPNGVLTPAEQIKKYVEGTNGAYRVPKLGAGLIQLGAEVSKQLGVAASSLEGLKAVAKPLKDAANGLGFMRFVALAIETPPAVQKAWEDASTENVLDGIRKATDLTSTGAFCWLAFTGSERAQNVGNVVGIIPDAIDAQEAAGKLVKLRELQVKNVTPEMREALQGEEKFHFLKLLKAVTAVASAIFAILALVLGGPVVPLLVVLTVSVASSIFAVWSHFHKEGMAYRLPLSDPQMVKDLTALPA